MTPICRIVGAGDFSPSLLPESRPGDFLIAADAGFSRLHSAGIQPDLYIGDGDSLGYTPQGVGAVVLPKVKDDTDTLAAIKEGLSRGFLRFELYGALGGDRFSHSIANLQTLFYLANHGATGTIVDSKCTVSLLTPGTYTLDLSGGYFSLFALDLPGTVSIENAKYPLKSTTISPYFPIGVSNEGEKETCITVEKGNLFLIRE